MAALKNYDATQLDANKLAFCNKILAIPEMNEDKVKNVSVAALSLFRFVNNICEIRSLLLGLPSAN